MPCYWASRCVVVTDCRGPGTSTPEVPGVWLTAVPRWSQHHITAADRATVHFHGLAGKLPSKQENHTCSPECSKYPCKKKKNPTGGSLPSNAAGKQREHRPENAGGETSLQVQSSGPAARLWQLRSEQLHPEEMTREPRSPCVTVMWFLMTGLPVLSREMGHYRCELGTAAASLQKPLAFTWGYIVWALCLLSCKGIDGFWSLTTWPQESCVY